MLVHRMVRQFVAAEYIGLFQPFRVVYILDRNKCDRQLKLIFAGLFQKAKACDNREVEYDP